MRPSGLRPKCSGVRVSPVKRSTVTRSNGMSSCRSRIRAFMQFAGGGMVVQDHARNLACRVCGEEWQPRPPLWPGWWVARPQRMRWRWSRGSTGPRSSASRPAERINVLTVDPARVRGVLSNERVAGRERVSAMARRVRAVAGVNGGFFAPSGDPVGVLAIDGELLSEPVDGRSALLLPSAAAQRLRVIAPGSLQGTHLCERTVAGDRRDRSDARPHPRVRRPRGRRSDDPPERAAHVHRLERARAALAPLRRPAARRGRRGGHRA